MKTINHTPFVNDDQNIVLRTDVIYTPAEFLQINAAVFTYARSVSAYEIQRDKINLIGQDK